MSMRSSSRPLRAGDARALERLLMKAQEVAYRFSHTVCGGPSDAEDVMQDALLKTFRYVKRIRDPHAFRTWLYRTVRNACLMKRRRRTGEPQRVLSLDDVLPSVTAGAAGRCGRAGPQPRGAGRQCRAAAAAEHRRCARCRRATAPSCFSARWKGSPRKTWRARLKMSESNVKMRLHRARLFLRKELEDR